MRLEVAAELPLNKSLKKNLCTLYNKYTLFLILNNTYMSINAIDKVSFLPNQSAIAPRARDPVMTPAMKMLIVIGGIQCFSQTSCHSET